MEVGVTDRAKEIADNRAVLGRSGQGESGRPGRTPRASLPKIITGDGTRFAKWWQRKGGFAIQKKFYSSYSRTCRQRPYRDTPSVCNCGEV
jgi:hypothetical protein